MAKKMTDKDKIAKYLDYKGISKNKFYIQTGLSIGFLDSGSSLGVDKLRLITDNYHDFNPLWLISDSEPMIKNSRNDNEDFIQSGSKKNENNLSQRIIQLMEEKIALLEEHKNLMKKIENLKEEIHNLKKDLMR